MKKTYRWIVGAAIVVVMCFIFTGSFLIYKVQFPGNVSHVGMALQNMAETLLFNPVLTLQDIAEMTKENPSLLSGINKFVMTGFRWSVVAAPLIDLLFVFSFFDGFLLWITGLTMKKRHVLVIGYNDKVRSLIKNGTDNLKIYLWTEKMLSAEELRDLAFHHVKAETNETPLGIRNKPERQRKNFNKYLSKKKITDVIVMQDTDTANIEYYMVLSQCDACKDRPIHFFVNIEDYGARLMLEDYFDKTLKSELAKDTDRKIMDLKIFNYSETQAHVLFKVLPLYKGTSKDNGYNVHLLIVGNNAMSEALILHAMNQGVITAHNRIIIDVFGENIESLRKKLAERFNTSYVENVGNTFQIDCSKSDGSLKICLFEGSVKSDDMIDTVIRRNESEAYTYFASCLDQPDENLYCYNKLKGVLGKIPVALNIPYIYEMKDYMRELDQTDGVFLMGSENEYLKFENLVNDDEEKKAREFNAIYNSLTLSSENYDEEKADAAWNRLLYYKRQSNRALYYHLPVKAFTSSAETGFAEAVNQFWDSEFGGNEYKEAEKYYSKKLMGNTEGILERYAMTEHRRFNYFYASEGWGFTEGEKNEPAKLHNCLCTWEKLIENKNTRNLLAYDVTSVRHIADRLSVEEKQ